MSSAYCWRHCQGHPVQYVPTSSRFHAMFWPVVRSPVLGLTFPGSLYFSAASRTKQWNRFPGICSFLSPPPPLPISPYVKICFFHNLLAKHNMLTNVIIHITCIIGRYCLFQSRVQPYSLKCFYLRKIGWFTVNLHNTLKCERLQFLELPEKCDFLARK